MKKTALLLSLGITLNTFAQINIGQNDMPHANDVLAQENALFTTAFDEGDTGPDHVWVFDETNLMLTGGVNQQECIDIATTPFAYQLFFNNPFDPNHNSDFAMGLTTLPGSTGNLPITLSEIYNYYQNTSSRYAICGQGVTISGVPVPSQGNPIDIVYDYPVAYGNVNSHDSQLIMDIPTIGYRKTIQNRVNEVDGWGTISIFGTTYNALRVKTTINATDSIYIDAFNFGLQFARPEAIEYKFLVHEWRVPVLQVNYTSGINTGTLVATTPTSVVETEAVNLQLNVFPNPTTEFLNVKFNASQAQLYTVFDATGKVCMQGKIASGNQIDVSALQAGIYLLVMPNAEAYFLKN